MKIKFFMISILCASFLFPAKAAHSAAVMSAYQSPYAMNFEIWKPRDLPAGWFATFDGFPVAQISPNRWVYGQLYIDGAIRPTNVLVGSVVPSSVPGLVRIASVWNFNGGKFIETKEFLQIRKQKLNRMGWLRDGWLNTIIAWHNRKIGVWIWLGNRWAFFEPNSGEYTWQMLKRITPYIINELRKVNAYYDGGEPTEVADLARQWGYIWNGKIILETLKSYRDSGGSSTENVTSMRDSGSGGSDSSPKENTNTGPRWDVD